MITARAFISGCFCVLALSGTACSSSDSDPDASTGPTDGGASVADATPRTDAGVRSDASVPSDAGLADAGAADGGPLVAVVGTRCAYQERRGLITIESNGGPPLFVNGQISSGPEPYFGPPALSDTACVFHEDTAACTTCSSTQVCSHEDMCVAPTVPLTDARLIIRGGGGMQTVSADTNGFFGAEVTVTSTVFSLEISATNLRIDVPAMGVPAALINPMGVLGGTYDAPTSVDLTWTAPPDAAEVYSLTRINHHVPKSTFTECVVSASSGMLHIDGAMLQPLSVSTGLEFQAIQHTRFAAVDTPEGCVEVRFTQPSFVSL